MFLRLVALAFPPNQFGRALWTTFIALAILATVWILQSVGYRPCELCLTERIAFYVGAPLAALTALAAYRAATVPARLGFVDDPAMRIFGVSLAGWDFVVSAALGLYAALAATLKR